MATRRTRRTADSMAQAGFDRASLDGYIKYLEALAKVLCKSDLNWSIATGIRVTKICPPPQKAGTRLIIVSKAACPPPQGGWSNLCEVVHSLIAYLKQLRRHLAR